MNDAFSSYHPSITFLYFAFVILVTIFIFHPVILAVSFAAGMAYSIYLNGVKAVKFNLFAVLPMMLVMAVFNPVFNHEGVTILLYVNDNPITLEAIWFGIAAAFMLGSVIMWFSCYNAVMTSDKFVYLFGRMIPALSLVLSMALRFVPRYKAQIKKITYAQRCAGRDISTGKWFSRVKNALAILSAMMTWALENAVETADSMKSRGYGLKGRSAYSIYRFDARDKTILGILALLAAFVFAAILFQIVDVRFYPSFRMNDLSMMSGLACAAFAAICFLPLILNIKEDAVWRSLRSQI